MPLWAGNRNTSSWIVPWRLPGRTWFRRAVEAGMAVVNVSPQASDVMTPNAEWLALRPNTDTALMLGLAHAIHEEGQLEARSELDERRGEEGAQGPNRVREHVSCRHE